MRPLETCNKALINLHTVLPVKEDGYLKNKFEKYFSKNVCGNNRIRTYSAEATDLQSVLTLQR